ncbi:hypothetical protein [Halostagnicola bangensis]
MGDSFDDPPAARDETLEELLDAEPLDALVTATTRDALRATTVTEAASESARTDGPIAVALS